MHLRINKTKLFAVLAGLSLLQTAHAWYPSSAYQPYSPYFANGPWHGYGNYGYAPGYRGYVQPRIHIRGHINRYGDYWMNFRISGISKQDIYTAWLWYNYLQQQ
jgi:hypothetical protein